MGIGLSIVRGMTEAMGGTAIAAREPRSADCAVDLDLPGRVASRRAERDATMTDRPAHAS